MKKHIVIATLLGVFAAIVNFLSMANYAFPGQSARLMVLWRGLDFSTSVPYPLMGFFAKLCGGANLLAPICGTLATVLLYIVVAAAVRARAEERIQEQRDTVAAIAGVVAALVFLLTPAVRAAASHLEPRLFDFTWALVIFALAPLALRFKGLLAMLLPLLVGILAGIGLCESFIFAALIPLFAVEIGAVQVARKRKPVLAIVLFALVMIISYLVSLRVAGVSLEDSARGFGAEIRTYWRLSGWFFVALFATAPMVTALFASKKGYGEAPTLVSWLSHLSLSFMTILAVATPLSPSSLMEPFGILPVATSAFAAVTAGYVVSYWWVNRARMVALAAGCVFAFVVLLAGGWHLFSFDASQGAFVDSVAERVLADMGDRTWIVSDGTLDDHLRLIAEQKGHPLEIVALNRDDDPAYLNRLSERVKACGLGGEKNDQLCLSLSLGVLPFLQDWLSTDPSVAKKTVIFGAPDLWYAAGLKPIPEFLFFGADETREGDWKDWKTFDELLKVPEGWGSYTSANERNPIARIRNFLRRHLGLVATDRGVHLQDLGRHDEAFAAYELVLSEIDPDNVCALFNEIEMAGQKHPKALAKQHDLEKKLKKVVDDKNRRYYIWRLGNLYGYIRNPEIFLRLGYVWAKSGRAGEALSQIRRAIDFVPSDRQSVLMNMMASLYANEADQRKSREIYQQILSKNDKDHDALVGLMRLELMNGDGDKALEYLEKAAAVSGEGTRARMELAMVAMMKNDLLRAATLLKQVTDEHPDDMQAWSLVAAVTMQRCDAAKDKKESDRLMKELNDVILPKMEKQGRGQFDYYVQATKAFLLLRQGAQKRKEARDAFVAAAKSRPDVSTTQDIVLGLDISLDDKEAAEAHAREVLRRNRQAPLANYVMGSIALGKGEYDRAEAFLRKAADAPKPVTLALNDLAEVLRRNQKFDEAERYARKAVEKEPTLYVAWETLGAILMDAKRNLKEAQSCVEKACEMSKGKDGREADVRMLVSLARVQLANGDTARAKGTIRKVQSRRSELSEFELQEFEELKKSVR